MSEKEGLTYAASGVDIEAANHSVELIKEMAKTTHVPGVLGGIGGFGGLFTLDTEKYPQPVLVSGTDGVGTKLKVAFWAGKHDTVGIDAVAMCVNDVLVQGARPLFFLDYLALPELIPAKVQAIVSGVAEGCRRAGCALIGGETAEMPGLYQKGEYDLAGFAVGVVNRDRMLDASHVQTGDVLIGLLSSGVHSNGFSLVRKIFFERCGLGPDSYLDHLGCTLGEELLKPTRIYVKSVLPLIEQKLVHGLCHITGGGMTENIPRVLPPGLGVEIRKGSWPKPPVFDLLEEMGGVEEQEMRRTFNMGIGMVLMTGEEKATAVCDLLRRAGEKPCLIGRVTEEPGVKYVI